MNKQVILIVEDEPDIREGIRILLEGEGYLILEAESGEQALRCMNDAVDLVILDIMLPGISGLKVCEELRQYSTVPILFLTAKTQESDKTIGLTAGGDTCPSPFPTPSSSPESKRCCAGTAFTGAKNSPLSWTKTTF